MTQDCDPNAPDIHHADEHNKASIMEVVSTRAEGSDGPGTIEAFLGALKLPGRYNLSENRGGEENK
jgi:hypothetical protein